MVRNYELKQPPIDKKRAQKYIKDTIDECNKDRQLALELHALFLNQSEGFWTEVDGEKVFIQPNAKLKELAVELLRLAQSSKQYKVRLLEAILKTQEKKSDVQSVEEDFFSNIE